MSADTRRAITQVNAQKLKYLEATYYLQRLQIALLFGKESDIGEYRERLDKATTDIEGWPKRSEEAFAWNVPKPYRIDLPETDRPRINVEIEPPAKMHVDIEPSRIDVKM
jgi:hypothetical protein